MVAGSIIILAKQKRLFAVEKTREILRKVRPPKNMNEIGILSFSLKVSIDGAGGGIVTYIITGRWCDHHIYIHILDQCHSLGFLTNESPTGVSISEKKTIEGVTFQNASSQK